jgi:phosphatidylserine/phosphatidylglycerophosphate/cardiolipin synthase-like enzyme
LEAMFAFIDAAQAGDELAVAIYEFQYEPILARMKAAIDRGVDVKILYDAGSTATSPRGDNERAIREARLLPNVRPRAGLRSYISHHKFMVLLHEGTPTAVWTGSTNMSVHGIYAQLNLAHVIQDREVAEGYLALHRQLWASDPSAKSTRSYLTATYPRIGLAQGHSSTSIFSPRSTQEAMTFYLNLLGHAKHLVLITTPFGVDSRIEQFLRTSSPTVIKFGLLGRPSSDGGVVTRLDSIDGTHYSMPARIDSALDRWQVEQFGYQSHAYVHTKFLLIDPLADSPTLVTGSANFSKASCINNDEDMLVVSDHPRVADVYLTEFLRMFEHYAFRQFLMLHPRASKRLPLAADDGWTNPYFVPRSRRERDRLLFSGESVQ